MRPVKVNAAVTVPVFPEAIDVPDVPFNVIPLVASVTEDRVEDVPYSKKTLSATLRGRTDPLRVALVPATLEASLVVTEGFFVSIWLSRVVNEVGLPKDVYHEENVEPKACRSASSSPAAMSSSSDIADDNDPPASK